MALKRVQFCVSPACLNSSLFLNTRSTPSTSRNPLKRSRKHPRSRQLHRFSGPAETLSLQKHARHRVRPRPPRKHFPRLPPDAILLQQYHGWVYVRFRFGAIRTAGDSCDSSCNCALGEAAVFAFSLRENLDHSQYRLMMAESCGLGYARTTTGWRPSASSISAFAARAASTGASADASAVAAMTFSVRRS